MDHDYKELCQVFTPSTNAKELLNWCDYTDKLNDKLVIENSCGNGKILEEVVARYIDDALKLGKNNTEIKKGLEENIYGIEYDFEKYTECIDNLNKITQRHGINNVMWKNIICQDALKKIKCNKFDFVVGNPPYIKYSALANNDREYIKKNFETCKRGKFDYCYAFIELSIKSLKKGGKMAYLIPSSIFKNVFAEDLREFIKPHLLKIYDYTTTKLFTKETNDERLTSSAIIILEKDSNQDYIEYIDITNKKNIKIAKKDLKDKWLFTNKMINNTKHQKRFGDYFKVSNTIATLYNKAYVIKDYIENKDYVLINGCKIEKDILKDTISPKNFDKHIKEKIIFPYYYDENNNLVRYSEEEFSSKFKYAAEYLKSFEQLKNRKSDKSALWFEYGRSQALNNSNCPKLLLSTIITDKVKTKLLPEDNIPYSGLYITVKKDKTLKEAEEILHSKEFFEYIKLKGICASGNSFRITANDISEYRF